MKKTITKTKISVAVGVGLIALAVAAMAFATISRFSPIISLNPSSPSGTAIPSFNSVLVFDITAPRSLISENDIQLNEILFSVASTDNASSGWNTCEQLGDMAKWAIRDSGGNRIDAVGDWNFYNSSKVLCSGSEIVAYAGTSFPSSVGAIVLENTTSPFTLYTDTTAASATTDDVLRISLERDPFALVWLDTSGVSRSGLSVRGLPLIGSTIIY